MKERLAVLKRTSLTFILVICLALIFLITDSAIADQTIIPNYRQASKIFWEDLYPNGGKSIYCGKNATKNATNNEEFNIEHVYPASWMKKAGDCVGSSRKKCREISSRFNLIEADLHNLYPSLEKLNRIRNNFSFSIIPGRATDSCDFEVKNKLVEPRPASRGNIARAIFYMNDEYGAEIAPPPGVNDSGNLESLLIYWHCKDPVDSEEINRNNLIETLQGTRNRFIDDPSLISCDGIQTFADD